MNRQALFTCLLIGATTLVYNRMNELPAVQQTLLNWNEQLISFVINYGLLGAFVISLISNASLGIPIPYSPFFILLASQAQSPTFLIALTAVGAIGSTIGEIISFYVGRGVSAAFVKENKTAAYIKQLVEKWPRLTTLYIFLAAATPFPDDFVVVPLGLMNYPIKRMILPILLGKALFLGVMVYLSHYAYLTISNYPGPGSINPSVFLLALILFGGFMVYRAKKGAAANE